VIVCDFVLEGVCVRLGVFGGVKLADMVPEIVPERVPDPERELVFVAFEVLEGVCELVVV
jgi:hypothetical protein